MPPADAPGFCKEICRFQRPKSGAVNAKTKSILAFTIQFKDPTYGPVLSVVTAEQWCIPNFICSYNINYANKERRIKRYYRISV